MRALLTDRWRLLFALACASCGGVTEDVSVTESNVTVSVMDVISPATCQQVVNSLKFCAFSPRKMTLAEPETAVPLRTVVTRTTSGNCSTQYPLALEFEHAGGVALYSYLSQSSTVIRRPDGGVIHGLDISDGSTWTSTAVFSSTCRVSVRVSANELDIDTVQQAQAVLDGIDLQIKAAEGDVRTYRTLLALQAAYAFTHAVAASFHQDLTNETMQALRQAAILAAPAMETAALGCGESLSDEQRFTLFDLYVSMVALGDPSSWQNPDGSTKSLEDFYGPGAAEVLADLQALSAQANPNLEAQYVAALDAANAELLELQQKRALAVLQLAPWLGQP